MRKQIIVGFLTFSAFAIITYQAVAQGDAHITPPEEPAHEQQTNSTPGKQINVNQDIIIKQAPSNIKKRTITVTNNITKKMISYTKCFVSYTPDFNLIINDEIIPPGHTRKVVVDNNNMLIVTYSYNFLNGYKKGKRSVSFELNPNQNAYEITFSWQNDWRLMIAQATPKKVDVIC